MNNDYRGYLRKNDYLAHYGVKGMEWGKHKAKDPTVGRRHSRAYNMYLNRYKNIIREAKRAGLKSKKDRRRTQFGNIDLNKRAVVTWDDKNLKKYEKQYKSLGYSREELKGSKSTVMGESRNYDGLEIALSPLLQKANGKAKLLGSKTIDRYVGKLFDKLSKKGVWTNEDLLKADREGIKIGKTKIKSIIADIGNTAIKTGEQMHFLGKDGAINLAKRDLKKAGRKENKTSVPSKKQLRTVSRDIINGKYGSGEKRKKLLTKKFGDWKTYQNNVNRMLGSKKRY